MLLILMLALLTWGFWFFCPLLVLPVVDILQHYLRSNMGRRLRGVTITTTTLERVGLLARLVTSLLLGGLLVGQVVDARKNQAGPAIRAARFLPQRSCWLSWPRRCWSAGISATLPTL
jgi:hypothetical protein